MSKRQYDAFRAGIAADGVLTPLAVTKKRVVLDGRHQLQAGPELGQIPAHRAAQQIRRAQRHATIGRAPAMPSGRFELIYADPPWQLGNPSSEWAPENYYPTLPLEEIKALQVPVTDDAVLFLWAV